MKFSIVIPVYNVEKYLDKCLNSVLNQSYKNFEVIIVDDESPDNSIDIINKYIKMDNRFKLYSKKNGGLSDARNFGVKQATGDYLIFLDSDDYIEKDLLLEISEIAKDNDIIKYNLKLVDEDGNLIKKARSFEVEGNATFKELINVEYFQPACSYAYNMDFWKNNKFEYEVGRVHEDFGLTPFCTLLAKKIYMLNYYGYNYVQREGSIMHGAEKIKKRAYDILYHFDNLISRIKDVNVDKENKILCESFLANTCIYMSSLIYINDRKDYICELKKREIWKYLIGNTYVRKLKKLMARFSLDLYIKYRFKTKK